MQGFLRGGGATKISKEYVKEGNAAGKAGCGRGSPSNFGGLPQDIFQKSTLFLAV